MTEIPPCHQLLWSPQPGKKWGESHTGWRNKTTHTVTPTSRCQRSAPYHIALRRESEWTVHQPTDYHEIASEPCIKTDKKINLAEDNLFFSANAIPHKDICTNTEGKKYITIQKVLLKSYPVSSSFTFLDDTLKGLNVASFPKAAYYYHQENKREKFMKRWSGKTGLIKKGLP